MLLNCHVITLTAVHKRKKKIIFHNSRRKSKFGFSVELGGNSMTSVPILRPCPDLKLYSVGSLRCDKTAHNWIIRCTFAEAKTTDECPLTVWAEGVYIRVYQESDEVFTCYMHTKVSISVRAAERLLETGSPLKLLKLVPWTGVYWPCVDTQRISKRVWEFGAPPRRCVYRRSCLAEPGSLLAPAKPGSLRATAKLQVRCPFFVNSLL